MAVLQHPSHSADVRDVLGVNADGEAGMAGIEIETGWVSEAKRKTFLTLLEEKGLLNKCISKPDGSIGTRGECYPAEIVSIPMPLDELAKFTRKVGAAIEERCEKGLITGECGVHIHMSEGLFDTNTLWRYVASVCQTPDYISSWLPSIDRDGAALDELHNKSDAVKHFWDAVCLRGETHYSSRRPYNKVRDIQTNTSHSRAIIHGQRTPTYETRIFRTSKSRRVMESYVEVVSSLHAFSKSPGDDHLEAASTHQITVEQIAKLKRTVCMPLHVSSDGASFYDDLGNQFRTPDVQWNGSLYGYFPSESILAQMGLRMATYEETILINDFNSLGSIVQLQGKGARGWVEGTIPLPAYIEFVLNNAKKYPNLAQRFGYDKFRAFAGKPQTETFPHRTEPHLEFKRGCLVRIEEGRNTVYSLNSDRGSIGLVTGVQTFDLVGVSVSAITNREINELVHACPGALEPGGEI